LNVKRPNRWKASGACSIGHMLPPMRDITRMIAVPTLSVCLPVRAAAAMSIASDVAPAAVTSAMMIVAPGWLPHLIPKRRPPSPISVRI